MSKVYSIKSNETGYEYKMTFYDDNVEIGYVRNGRYSLLFDFFPIENQYELDDIRDNCFTSYMFNDISECSSLEEAKDMAVIAFEADSLFDYVFDNWECPDDEY